MFSEIGSKQFVDFGGFIYLLSCSAREKKPAMGLKFSY